MLFSLVVQKNLFVHKLHLIQDCDAKILTTTRKKEFIALVLANLRSDYLLRLTDFKVLLILYKALNGLGIAQFFVFL